jgi:transposase InsO family protein
MAVDYRGVNRLTVPNRWPLPRIDDLFDQVREGKVFSSLDLTSAYHHIRLRDSDVTKTAFTTPQGLYEFKVLPFGLRNAPSVFAHTMHKVLGEYVGKFVILYLDDILVFSATPEEHERHVRLVLERLRTARFTVNEAKCKFFQNEVKFLGHVISADGIRVNEDKIAAVKEWPEPRSTKDVQRFLGLTNFFRRFVQGYSSIAAPLLNLASGNYRGDAFLRQFTPPVARAFERLKLALTHTPVLAHPDPNKPYTVVSDASVNGTGAVLLQEGRPIAYHSHKFTSTERGYHTGEQELLGVILALQEFRCYVQGCVGGLTVDTDHEPLTFLRTQEVLPRKKARWLDFLEEFEFKWRHIPGRDNVADPLSRRPDFESDPEACVAAFLTERLPEGDTWLTQPVLDLIRQTYDEDAWFATPRNVASLHLEDGLYYGTDASDSRRRAPKVHQIVIPNSTRLKSRILHELHDVPSAGHRGRSSTLELVLRQFWWPRVRADVFEYVDSCHSCQVQKPSHQLPAGTMHPLPIPSHNWESISLDLVTGLPKRKGFDAVLVIVDRLSKMAVLLPTTESASASKVAKLVFDAVVSVHGWPTSIVSDRDPRFTSHFWRTMCERWGITARMGTSFHPQTDGQTERMNKLMEETVRHFVDAKQTNWPSCLAMAQFAINNAVSRSTAFSPFFLNYGRHPRVPLHGTRVLPGDDEHAVSFAETLERARQEAQRALTRAQDRQRTYANRFRRSVRYLVNDEVLLSTKHLSYARGLARKFLPRFTGPFRITRVIDKGDETVAVTLRLPDAWKVHPTFHVSRVRPFIPSSDLPPAPPPTLTEPADLAFELDRIHSHRGRGRQLQYLVQWKGGSMLMWEPARHLDPADPVLVAYRGIAVPPDDPPLVGVPPLPPRRSSRLLDRQSRLRRAASKGGESVGSGRAPPAAPATDSADDGSDEDPTDPYRWMACPAHVLE